MIKRPLLLILILQVVCILAVYRIPALKMLRYSASNSEIPDDVRVSVLGIVDDVTGGAGNYRIYLNNSNVLFEHESYAFDKMLIYSGEESCELLPGYLLRAEGDFFRFSHPENDGMFDSKKYYNARGYEAFIYSDELKFSDSFLQGTKGKWIQSFWYKLKRYLFLFRRQMTDSLLAVFPADEAGEAIAMLLGDKAYLSDEIKELYRGGGILHILSISGLHITLLGMGFYKLLRRLKRSLLSSVLITISVMALYGAMTGFAVSTVRSVLMLIILLLGRLLGKVYDLISGASLTAIILLLVQPLYLFDTGFLLSFTAVFAVGICSVLFDVRKISAGEQVKMALKKPYIRKTFETLLVCSTIQLMTLPLIINSYYEFPVYAIIINLIILPLVSFIVVFSLLAGITGLFFGLCGQFFAGSAYILFNIIEKVCSVSEGLPFSTYTCGEMSRSRVLFYYFLLGLLFSVLHFKYFSGERKQKNDNSAGYKIRQFECLHFVLAVSILLILFIPGYTPFYMAVLDVGQGDCIYVESGDHCMLIDCGSSSIKGVFEKRVSGFLKSRGRTDIDCVIISHPDSDHINGIKEIAESNSFSVGEYLVGLPCEESALYSEYAEKLGFLMDNYAVRTVKAGDIYWLSKVEVEILNPGDRSYSNTNEASITLCLSYCNFSALLMADSEGSGEQQTINRLSKSPDIIKIAHHGSNNSTSAELLQETKPLFGLISVGKNNRYGHPGDELLKRLKRQDISVLRTDQHHQISIVIK